MNGWTFGPGGFPYFCAEQNRPAGSAEKNCAFHRFCVAHGMYRIRCKSALLFLLTALVTGMGLGGRSILTLWATASVRRAARHRSTRAYRGSGGTACRGAGPDAPRRQLTLAGKSRNWPSISNRLGVGRSKAARPSSARQYSRPSANTAAPVVRPFKWSRPSGRFPCRGRPSGPFRLPA